MSDEKANMQNDTRLYEAAYLISPQVPEEQATSIFLPVKNLLASKNLTISGESAPIFRRLAYQIGCFDSAFFGWVRFESDSETAFAVKKILSETKEIIRFLLIKASVAEPVRMFVKRSAKRAEHSTEPIPFESKLSTPRTEEAQKGIVSEEELNKKIEELVGA
jgi:ribosomal protein S6